MCRVHAPLHPCLLTVYSLKITVCQKVESHAPPYDTSLSPGKARAFTCLSHVPKWQLTTVHDVKNFVPCHAVMPMWFHASLCCQEGSTSKLFISSIVIQSMLYVIGLRQSRKGDIESID